jgi:hypothetical protein
MTDYADFAKYVELVKKYPKRRRALTLGDSWFQYPLRRYADIQRRIDTRFANKLLCLDDSNPGRDADETSALKDRWHRLAGYLEGEIGKPFNLMLVSLGGNDVIGKDFARHLKKPQDPPVGTTWPWNDAIPEVARRYLKLKPLAETFDAVRSAYLDLIAIRKAAFATGSSIVTHTYANVTPSNEPYTFVGFKAGPWLWKPMVDHGLIDPAAQRVLSGWLLESFWKLLVDVKRTTQNFVILDSRLQLPDYDGWWDNEIHPRGKGFELLVEDYWAPAVEAAI